MKTIVNRLKLSVLVLMVSISAITLGQGGLTGTWKYVSPGGEMTLQIGANTITINSQTFTYKAQGNVLMINEGTTTTPYPYMLDGDNLTLEFPGGMGIVFIRTTGSQAGGSLPQSMSKPSGGPVQNPGASSLSGRWLFRNQQGELVLEFLSVNQLSFNGEKTQYQLKEGIIQAMGDYGWIDYPYILSQGTLTITFPDGSRFLFIKASSATTGQEVLSQPANQGTMTWQLKGALCSWSGSSNSSSSYSSTQKIVFDGLGNFQFGSESSFSSNAGIAYGGNPNVKSGRYTVGERAVTLYYQDGNTYEFRINMRQDNGMITELMYSGTLFAKGLCE
jgi:hypothetical protein